MHVHLWEIHKKKYKWYRFNICCISSILHDISNSSGVWYPHGEWTLLWIDYWQEKRSRGKILHVYKDTIETRRKSNGREGSSPAHWRCWYRSGRWRWQVLLRQTMEICPTRRNPRIPAGKKEHGEDSLTTAKREIQEETGYTGKDWVYMGKIYPTPAYDTEVIDLYYAKVDQYVGQSLDEDEEIQIYQYRLEELVNLIMEGKIPDAKTVSMAMLIKELKNRGKI